MGEITLGMMLFLVGLVSDDKLINNIMVRISCIFWKDDDVLFILDQHA